MFTFILPLPISPSLSWPLFVGWAFRRGCFAAIIGYETISLWPCKNASAGTEFAFPSATPWRNCLRRRIRHQRNTDLRLEVMPRLCLRLVHGRPAIESPETTFVFFQGASVFCHLDTTQYHRNLVPVKLEQTVLSSCTHVLFGSADADFDAIANNWYTGERSNGTS